MTAGPGLGASGDKLETTPAGADFGERDSSIAISLYTTIRLRAVVPRRDAGAYWLDVHGPLAARSPGVHWYAQHHFAPSHDDHLWPLPDGVDPAPGYVLDGAVEMGFAGQPGIRDFVSAAAVLGTDQRNVFEQTVAYADPTGAATIVDRQADPWPNGPDGLDRLHVHLFPRSGAAPELAAWVRNVLGPEYACSPEVGKVRVHTPVPYDNDHPAPPAPGVDHVVADERLSAVIVEMAFTDPLARRRFHASEAFLAGQARLASLTAHLTAFAVSGMYVYVRGGVLGTVGLRGSRAASLISSLAAVNQTEDEVRRRFVPG